VFPLLFSNDFLSWFVATQIFTAAVHSFSIVQYSHSFIKIINMPSSSLILSVGTILSAFSSTVAATKYQQEESFNGKNWLDAFKFETYDLNNGFVNYVDQSTAMSNGLYSTSGDDVLFGVDSTETLDYKSGPGRKSVRLEGRKNYNKGLFVIDIKRMPGVCGMWPAFWSLGQEPWPVKGEVCSSTMRQCI
jgi:hypothetical protein